MFELQKGDKVAIVAPSGQIGDKAKIVAGLDYLKKMGLKPILMPNVLAQYRYMAGTDKERAADINAAFADSAVKALFCVRAAAGASRILPYIDYKTAQKNPKPLIGFCDNAALMSALWQKSGIQSLNGFLLTYDFLHGKPDAMVEQDLNSWLSGQKPVFQNGTCLQKGHAQGEILPINLSVLMRLTGTDYFPDLRGKILLIEDIHERVHKIDLMLQQLKQQPNFNKLKGIIFGLFTDSSGDEEDGSIDSCINDFLQGVTVPVIKDFAFGHVPEHHILPFGAKVKMDAEQTTLKFI
jgi:muramoyltetrapeptide carboxypeptidase